MIEVDQKKGMTKIETETIVMTDPDKDQMTDTMTEGGMTGQGKDHMTDIEEQTGQETDQVIGTGIDQAVETGDHTDHPHHIGVIDHQAKREKHVITVER